MTDLLYYQNPQMGWICPRCNRVYSPYVGSCGTCGPTLSSGSTANIGSELGQWESFGVENLSNSLDKIEGEEDGDER